MNSKGKQLAIWGLVLQSGSFVGHFVTIFFTIRAFLQANTTAPNQAEVVASSVAIALYVTLIAMILFIIGAVLLLIDLFKMKYRAPWFKTAMWIISVLWIFDFPVGTVLGIIVMIYLNKHGAEFMGQVEPPALGDI